MVPGANDLTLDNWRKVVALIGETLDGKFSFSDTNRALWSALR